MKQAQTKRIDLKDERHRMTLAALDDVDAGRVVDHRLVQAWADSLETETPHMSPPK